jgi:FixJ family two-component response regulator
LIKTVYIVDDDDAVRDSLRGLLEMNFYKIEAFASGREFLARYRPDIEGCLVLDVNMPGLDGFDVLGRLGRPRAELPVIMITAQGDQSFETRALDAGARALIQKPFAADRLLALLRGAVLQPTDAG